jgi:hypothetical protein
MEEAQYHIKNKNKTDKTDCSNNQGILLLQTSYNILLNILLSKLNAYRQNYWGSSARIQYNKPNTDLILLHFSVIRDKMGV